MQIQSYIVTAAKYDFSVHEKRILYRIIEICQSKIKGQKLNYSFTVEEGLWGDYKFTLPIKSLLAPTDNNKNHAIVKQALAALRNKTFEYETEKRWELIGIIESPAIEKGNEFVEFRVNPKVFDAVLDFSKGFRAYELKTIMSFSSIYAMRFYELMAQQKTVLTLSVDSLKDKFKVSEKYKLYADFKRYVLLRAQKELDKNSPYSFTFSENKTGRKVTSIDFYPQYIPANSDVELEKKQLKKQITTTAFISKEVKDYLMHTFGFLNNEIKNNIEHIQYLEQQLGKFKCVEFFNSLKGGFRIAETNPKGYIIGACKKKANELKLQ